MELALILFIPVIIPILVIILILIFSSKWQLTLKEKQHFQLQQDKNIPSKKAIGFKIATTTILSIPTLFCIINIFCEGLGYRDVLNPYLFLVFPFLLTFVCSFPPISYLNLIFLVTSNKKALFFLTLPFIPSFVLGLYFITLHFIFNEVIFELFYYIATAFLISSTVVITIMAIILFSIRKKE